MATFYSIGRLAEPIFQSPRHNHQTWEICLYTQGEGIITVGTEPFPFRPGAILCLPPVIPHEEYSTTGYNLFFIHTDSVLENDVAVPTFHDSQDQRFQRVATLLYQEFLQQEAGWQEMTQQLFSLLLSYLNRWSARHTHPLVEQLIQILLTNFHDPHLHVGDAMAQMPISGDHLRLLFAQTTGKTPIQYVTSLRMNEARQLLQTRAFSVKEVARRVGYFDPYYFSRLFCKLYGVRPGEYAQQHPQHADR